MSPAAGQGGSNNLTSKTEPIRLPSPPHWGAWDWAVIQAPEVEEEDKHMGAHMGKPRHREGY